jgi:predicted DNA-binding transcriptional regulator AlpA
LLPFGAPDWEFKMNSKKKKVVEDDRLISKPEVLDRVGVTFPTVWNWMRENKFPRSRMVNGKTVWLSSEIDQWIADRPASRLKGDAEWVA